MENSNFILNEPPLEGGLNEMFANCYGGMANFNSLSEERQKEVMDLFGLIRYKDIVDQSFWSLGGGLNHYNLSLSEIKFALIEILSSRSEERERIILKELFLFLNILDEPSFYQINAIRNLMNCPEEAFDGLLDKTKESFYR